MSSRKEAIVLTLTILITTGIAGAGFWRVMYFNQSSFDLQRESLRTGETPSASQMLIKSPQINSTQSEPETFASLQNVPKGVFNYGGSTTWAPIRRDVDAAIQTVFPQFRLRYVQPTSGVVSSGSGLKMLLDNQLSFAQSSSPLKSKDYEEARKRGYELREIPIAIDAFAVVVHPSLNIPGLSVAEIDQIFAGKIINWKEVGGPDLRIKAYVKGTSQPSTYLQFVPTTTEALRRVEKETEAIFQASASLFITQCTVKMLPLRNSNSTFVSPYKLPLVSGSECLAKGNRLNKEAFLSGEYPNTRRLFVIVKRDNQLDQKGGETYANLLLTDQGQDLVEKAGFVRIR